MKCKHCGNPIKKNLDPDSIHKYLHTTTKCLDGNYDELGHCDWYKKGINVDFTATPEEKEEEIKTKPLKVKKEKVLDYKGKLQCGNCGTPITLHITEKYICYIHEPLKNGVQRFNCDSYVPNKKGYACLDSKYANADNYSKGELISIPEGFSFNSKQDNDTIKVECNINIINTPVGRKFKKIS